MDHSEKEKELEELIREDVRIHAEKAFTENDLGETYLDAIKYLDPNTDEQTQNNFLELCKNIFCISFTEGYVGGIKNMLEII